MKYGIQRPPSRRRWPRRIIIIVLVLAVVVVGATFAARRLYADQLKAVDPMNQSSVSVTIKDGASANDIAQLLAKNHLIRSQWAFKLYVSGKEVRNALQAGTYSLEPSQSVAEIVSQLTHGKISTDLVTILPAQRLDQIRARLIKDGFSEQDVNAALSPAQYANNPALVDKPQGASLEGYLYPDSFERTTSTQAKDVIAQSLKQMELHLTPDLRSAFAKQGLSTYQGIILASIVEKEVSKPSDRDLVAQVLLKRLRTNMVLGTDVTAFYGAIVDGKKAAVDYDSPYNSHLHPGLPPTPISNVTASSLNAVAHPATTDWLYFVSGDDGTTYFSKTLQEHENYTQQYCHTLCGRP